jgi:hypothetical protein
VPFKPQEREFGLGSVETQPASEKVFFFFGEILGELLGVDRKK